MAAAGTAWRASQSRRQLAWSIRPTSAHPPYRFRGANGRRERSLVLPSGILLRRRLNGRHVTTDGNAGPFCLLGLLRLVGARGLLLLLILGALRAFALENRRRIRTRGRNSFEATSAPIGVLLSYRKIRVGHTHHLIGYAIRLTLKRIIDLSDNNVCLGGSWEWRCRERI